MKNLITTIAILIIGSISVTYLFDFPPKSNSKLKYAHISFDDVENVFEDIIRHETDYKSIFDNQFLSLLQEYHNKYNAKFTLYTYEKTPNYTLSDFPIKYKSEFIKNSDWLKIGFHWIEPEFNKNISIEEFYRSFNTVNNLITNFAGDSTLTTTLRFHYFYGPDSLLTSINIGGGIPYYVLTPKVV